MRHNRRKRFFSYKLMFDVIICLICPLPFCEYKFYFVEYVPSEKNHLEAEYLVSDIILILMFSRIYLVIRNALNHTEFTDPYAKLHWERHGFTANARFWFRWFMAKYPGITVVTILSLSVFILSYILRITERSFLNKYMEWKSYNPINNIYLIIVTMTTVGFGDYVPYTTLGKLVTMITALWGAFIISLLIVSVNAIFTLSPKQKVAYDKLIRVRTAAKCIISAMRYHVINTKLKYAQNIRVTRSSRSSIYISDAIVSKYWKIFEKNIKKFKEISKSVKISGERSAVTSKVSTFMNLFTRHLLKWHSFDIVWLVKETYLIPLYS